MRHWIVLLTCSIIMLFPVWYTKAQAQLQEIFLTYYPTPVDNPQVISKIIEQIDEQVQKYGYKLNVIELSLGQTDPRQLISLSYGDQFLTISVDKTPLREVSPILIESDVVFTWLATDVTANMLTGMLLYTLHHCDDAMPYWDYVIDNHRSYIDREAVPVLRGDCAALEGDYSGAIRHYESQYSEYWIESTQPEYYLNLGWFYLQTGDEVKAFELADFAVKISSYYEVEQSLFLSKRAQLYAAIANYHAAFDDLNNAIKIGEDIISGQTITPEYIPFNEINLAEYYILRGQIYLNMYEWDKSLNDFNTAIELAPDYADTYFQRGVLYYSILQTGQELREEALADFRHYLELAPDGQYADQAREYADKIEAELAALNE